ncbi:T9SS type A sorting domain-containing protein [bacterium]|nr:T9SS type A sorting domain-containing protein [bacterium]
MKKSFTVFIFLTLCLSYVYGQVAELDFLGQTPGGSSYDLLYDEDGEKLIVGCGTSIWVYDMTDPLDAELIALRPFKGLVNEFILDGDILFAAATHDGLWALDYTSPTLDPIAHVTTLGDSAAYDLWKTGDTIYLADHVDIAIYTFDGSEFTEIYRIPDIFGKSISVARRNDVLAVAWWNVLSGTIELYHTSDLTTPFASWHSGQLANVQNLYFADNRDDILYVCGGTNNFGLSSSFYGLVIEGDSLRQVARYAIGGVPGLANAQITKMESRNDTIFVVTTAGLNGLESDIPVLDATGLPADTFHLIAHIRPGLWYFDVALMGGTPYMAIASEFFGVWISDITGLAPLDTVAVYPTGGWAQRCYLRNDTIWACMRGYGLVLFDVDDLYYSDVFRYPREVLRINSEFTFDFTFVDDTLIFIGHSIYYDVYNLAPWYDGGEPEFVTRLTNSTGIDGAECMAFVETDVGPRVLGGVHPDLIEFYDPYSGPDYPLIATADVGGDPTEFIVCGDTLFVGANIDAQRSIAAYRVTGDTLELLAHAPAANTIPKIAKEGNILAAALTSVGCAWYAYEGDNINPLGSIGGINALDVELNDGYLYVAEKNGLLVYDISAPPNAVLIASWRGTGGWQGMFGSQSVTVGDDGTIYLSDFNGGIFVIESLDSATGIIQQHATSVPDRLSIMTYPNPFNSILNIKIPQGKYNVNIFDVTGRCVKQFGGVNSTDGIIKWDASEESSGVYFITNEEKDVVGKVVLMR